MTLRELIRALNAIVNDLEGHDGRDVVLYDDDLGRNLDFKLTKSPNTLSWRWDKDNVCVEIDVVELD